MSRGGFGGRGRGGGFGGRGRGGGGFGGRGRGGRGGFNRSYDAGPPDNVTELGYFTHTCEDDIVCKVVIKDVPFFNAPVYFENKQQIGQIDEIFGPILDYFVSVKLAQDMKASSFNKDQKIYIDPNKLLPFARFLPKADGTPSTPGRGRGGGRGGRGGRGGGGGRGSFGRGGRGGFDRGRGRGGFGGRGGGFNDRGGRGGGFNDRGGRGGGFNDRGGRGRGGFDRGGFKRSFDGGNNSFTQNKITKFE